MLRDVEAADPELAREARRLVAVAEAADLAPGGALATGLLRGLTSDVQTIPLGHREQIERGDCLNWA